MITARVYTGKPPVAVIEGAYTGCHDAVFVSTWPDLTKAGGTKIHQNHSQAPLEVFFI
jgi:glutamate-1-semialdehyde aminotransferase